MQRCLIGLLAFSLTVLTAASAGAQTACLFDAPFKAKGLKTHMVRAYASCPGITQTINAATGAGVPGCSPPAPLSQYSFGPKGRCSVKTRQTIAAPCTNGTDPSCTVLSLRLKCSGILGPDGDTPISGLGWSLSATTRTIVADPQGTPLDPNDDVDIQIIDFPSSFNAPMASNGRFRLKIPEALQPTLFSFWPQPSLPPCMQIQFLSLTVRDPDGNAFAVMGSSTR